MMLRSSERLVGWEEYQRKGSHGKNRMLTDKTLWPLLVSCPCVQSVSLASIGSEPA
jgi:hypothetical protein